MTIEEKLWIWLAWILPRKLVYWTVIRAASVIDRCPDAISVIETLKEWSKTK